MDGMHMDERKQDAMSESMLKALIEEQENEQQIEREIRRVKKTNSTFETLANRIIKDAQNGQSHRSVASSVLSNIGVGVTPKDNNPNPLRHIGQRAQKIPLKTRKVRRIKRQSKAPLRTRHRPSIGQQSTQMSPRTLLQ
jgi:hypothetical protein